MTAASISSAARPASNRPPMRVSFVAVAALLVAVAALLPLGFVIWVAIQSGWDTIGALVFRPRVGELLVNTALLVVVTVPLCVVLAVALAWLTERSDLPGARMWAWLAVAPLAVPAFCPQLCVDYPGTGLVRFARWRAGLGAGLLSVLVPSHIRHAAPA